MRASWIRKVLVGTALSSVLGTCALAQQSRSEEGKRKVKTKVAPVYPDLARRMNVMGRVKIEVIITPEWASEEHARDGWPPAPGAGLSGCGEGMEVRSGSGGNHAGD